ncbi:hypothetical protein EOI86_23230 [Hwanghaeella grinnelliae]|uniref:Aryl sulfotransferase n=1 Tax=Hwanghaeella grinnelliae TaxID=2500179 RepID=A0A3S2W2C9_9PROT|nr:arylsulfotransferase family protein [Hwanghaeella grinnelliae]RVU34035.1 hypothetical protein EOI86_23230 [Hwanghaeella grinnelliae]
MQQRIPIWLFLLCLLLWLLFTVAFGWSIKSTIAGSDKSGWFGEAAVHVASFPTTTKEVVHELLSFVSGAYEDEPVRTPRPAGVDYSGFTPVPDAPSLKLNGLVMEADPTKMASGWRALIGAFDINGSIENAVLLLSPDLKLVKSWILDEVSVGEVTPRPKHRKFVHGVEIFPDGSIVFTFDGSVSIQKFTACGERDWTTPGHFHHAVTADIDGKSVWTFFDPETITQVSVSDGSILDQISLAEIISANPTIDVLEVRRKHSDDLGGNSRNTTGTWLQDAIHFNDVDPLPASIANQFDSFEAGDLLISARSLNLVFVLDRKSHKIKWWRVGATQRQHDPDWLPDGRISIFNNRMSRDFSEIVAIDPDTFETSVLVDGNDYGFYSRIRGKAQIIENGSIFVTSAQQGEAFEVDSNGEVVFKVANMKPGTNDTNYVVSEMKWLPQDFFDERIFECRTQE